MTVDYNLVVLGATPAGVAAAIAAARRQARVALVTQVEDWPLAEALRWQWALRDPGRPGRSLQASTTPIGRLTQLGIDVVIGRGQFERRGRDRWVQVGGRSLRSRAYLLAPRAIAAGLSPLQAAEGMVGAGPLTVLGDRSAGVVLAQALAKRGRSVTLLTNHGTLLCPEDPEDPGYERYDRELAYLLQCQLEADGIEVKTQVDLGAWASNGPLDQTIFNQGEQPDFEGWGLETLGLRLQADGRPQSTQLRSQVRSVWVCGLAAGSEAGVDQPWIGEQEAEQVVRSLLNWPRSARPLGPMPWVVGTTTPLVSLGLTEDLARSQQRRIQVLRADLGDSWRSQLMDQTTGRLKIIADRRGRILGAHALAPEAPEWMGVLSLAMQRGVTLAQLSELPIASTTYAALVVQLAEPRRSKRQDYWAERWFNWRRTGSV
jgi:pyruvate/2-oxoglutarate dehydrogenase complex dihydrolipoamide dehydrogenase (E3) component